MERHPTLDTILAPHTLVKMNANRKADREHIARELVTIATRYGAQTERREEGYRRGGIFLRFKLNGVGAQMTIDGLHGGGSTIISWHNSEYPSRDFAPTFCYAVAGGGRRAQHKATSCPTDWYGLARCLDMGLFMAAHGDAFEPAAP